MHKKQIKWHIVLTNSGGVKGAAKHAYATTRRKRDYIIRVFEKAPVIFKDAAPSIAVTKIVATRGWYHFTSTRPILRRFSERRAKH